MGWWKMKEKIKNHCRRAVLLQWLLMKRFQERRLELEEEGGVWGHGDVGGEVDLAAG